MLTCLQWNLAGNSHLALGLVHCHHALDHNGHILEHMPLHHVSRVRCSVRSQRQEDSADLRWAPQPLSQMHCTPSSRPAAAIPRHSARVP